MWVMSCVTYGCDNIMCDRYVEWWYMCDDCYHKFKSLYSNETSYRKLRELLEDFRDNLYDEHTVIDDFLSGE